MGWSGNLNTSNEYIKYRIGVALASQNVANNTSTVNVQVFIFRTNTGYTTSGNGTCFCKINGITYSSAISSAQKITSDGILLFNMFVDVGHNPDGSKTLDCSAWITHDRFSSVEQGYSEALPAIPRTSKPTVAILGWNLGENITISTNRASTAFTHTISYRFGNATGIIATGVEDSVNWVPPVNLATQIPSSTTGTLEIFCETVVNGQSIGTEGVNIRRDVPENVIPSFTPYVDDYENLWTRYNNKMIKTKSRFDIRFVNPSGAYGSSIVSYNIAIDGVTVSNQSSYISNFIATAGNKRITLSLTDSRGRSASWEGVYTVLDYSAPVINEFTVYRSNSQQGYDEDGSYFLATYNYSITPLDNLNGKDVSIKYKESTSAQWVDVLHKTDAYSARSTVHGIASTEKSYSFKITITDSFGTIERTINLSSAFTLIDFNSSGHGIAFGKVSEDNSFDCNLDATFKSARTKSGIDLEKVGKCTPVFGPQNKIKDVLNVTTSASSWETPDSFGYIAQEANSSDPIVNGPPVTGAFYAIREVLKVQSVNINGTTRNGCQVMVRLTETFPVAGRMWFRVYNTDSRTWTSAWKSITPS